MQSGLMTSLRFEEISLHCRNIDIFHQFCGIMGSILSVMGGIMGRKFEPNGTPPSKAQAKRLDFSLDFFLNI